MKLQSSKITPDDIKVTIPFGKGLLFSIKLECFIVMLLFIAETELALDPRHSEKFELTTVMFSP